MRGLVVFGIHLIGETVFLLKSLYQLGFVHFFGFYFWMQNPIFAQLVISLNLVLAGLRLGLKNHQVGEKWVSDDCSYL
jgi:predicted NACHT family NTPase